MQLSLRHLVRPTRRLEIGNARCLRPKIAAFLKGQGGKDFGQSSSSPDFQRPPLETIQLAFTGLSLQSLHEWLADDFIYMVPSDAAVRGLHHATDTPPPPPPLASIAMPDGQDLTYYHVSDKEIESLLYTHGASSRIGRDAYIEAMLAERHLFPDLRVAVEPLPHPSAPPTHPPSSTVPTSWLGAVAGVAALESIQHPPTIRCVLICTGHHTGGPYRPRGDDSLPAISPTGRAMTKRIVVAVRLRNGKVGEIVRLSPNPPLSLYRELGGHPEQHYQRLLVTALRELFTMPPTNVSKESGGSVHAREGEGQHYPLRASSEPGGRLVSTPASMHIPPQHGHDRPSTPIPFHAASSPAPLYSAFHDDALVEFRFGQHSDATWSLLRPSSRNLMPWADYLAHMRQSFPDLHISSISTSGVVELDPDASGAGTCQWQMHGTCILRGSHPKNAAPFVPLLGLGAKLPALPPHGEHMSLPEVEVVAKLLHGKVRRLILHNAGPLAIWASTAAASMNKTARDHHESAVPQRASTQHPGRTSSSRSSGEKMTATTTWRYTGTATLFGNLPPPPHPHHEPPTPMTTEEEEMQIEETDPTSV